MSRDELIKMAADCGAFIEIYAPDEIGVLVRFGEAVAAAERKACAALCDEYGMPDGTSRTAQMLAQVIRNRGKQ